MSRASTEVRPEGADWYLSIGRIINSEWIKARSVRPTRWWGGAAVVLGLLVGVLVALTIPTGSAIDLDSQRSDEVITVTAGVIAMQLVAGVVGVITISSEYGSGMINTTFVAVPRRWPAMLGKLVLLVAFTYVVSVLTLVVTALITAPILKSRGVSAHLTDPLVFGPISGAALYLGLIAAFAFFVTVIIRNTAGAISVMLGAVLVLPVLLSVIGGIVKSVWLQNAVSFLPQPAGSRLYAYVGNAEYLATGGTTGVMLTAGQGLLVLVGWIAALGILAFALLKARDA